MNVWWLLTPLLSTFLGWIIVRMLVGLLLHPLNPTKIFGFTFQGILLKQRPELSGKLAIILSKELPSFKEIEERLVSPGNFEKMIPEIEVHIDHFLAVKLKEKMPVVGMFVGERTISQLKEIFMEELKTLFPLIMKNYITGLESDVNLEQIITEKLTSIPDETLLSYINQLAAKQLNFLPVLGAFIGFIIGSIQISIILILYK